MGKGKRRLFAAIHIGSERVSLQIAEYEDLEHVAIIERLSRQIMLGEETFKTGRLSFTTVNKLCDLLLGYRRMLREYKIKDYRLLATTAVLEAENQPYIVDQIRMKTGLIAKPIEMPREVFYKYMALYKATCDAGLPIEKGAVLFVDISSGGVGIMLHQDGLLRYQQNIYIGALRVKERFEQYQRESRKFHKALAQYIHSVIEPVELELKKEPVRQVILSGDETELLLKMLGNAEHEGQKLKVVSALRFYALYKRVSELNAAQIMQVFHLTEHEVEMVLPTLVLYEKILSLSKATEIIIANERFIDGVLLRHIAKACKSRWVAVIEDQMLSLARAIGKKYEYDARHAEQVAQIALSLFDGLGRFHGLGQQDRLLLRVACILHDIGKFVCLRNHYVHSRRLILSSDMLGFTSEEKNIMANLAFYHDEGRPSEADDNFAKMTKEEKVIVGKLAAILRLADALDRSHRQKIQHVSIRVKNMDAIIAVEAEEDIALEKWTFNQKAEFFESVYGLRTFLEQAVAQRV